MKLRRLTGLLLSLVLLFCTGCSQSAAPRSTPSPTAEEQALSSPPEASAKALPISRQRKLSPTKKPILRLLRRLPSRSVPIFRSAR